jgi:hypothetical protein
MVGSGNAFARSMANDTPSGSNGDKISGQSMANATPIDGGSSSSNTADSDSTLKILSQNEIRDDNKDFPSYKIVGEVKNNGDKTATFVKISATLYDKSGAVVGTDFAFTSPSDVKAGHKAPFEVSVLKDNVKGHDFDIIDHYELQVSSG